MSSAPYFSTMPVQDIPTYGLTENDDLKPVVLVVDDERLIADTLAAILNQNGYAAIPAYGPAAALELAELIPPNLLITDVMMPGMSGVDLAILVQNSNPSCAIILFSGQASTVDLLASARTKGYTFNTLSKPVHPAVMLSHVASCFPLSMRAAALTQ